MFLFLSAQCLGLYLQGFGGVCHRFLFVLSELGSFRVRRVEMGILDLFVRLL